MGFKTPGEVYAALELAGATKCHDMPWHRTLTQGFLAGLYISFGAISAITAAYGLPSQWISTGPGLRSLVFGSVFPVGIILVIFTGAELLTGNMMVDVIDLVHRRSRKTMIGVAKNWTLSWIGNFAGCLFAAYLLVYQAGLFAEEPYLTAVQKIAIKKVNTLKAYQIFLRAIGCNTLVCVAIFCSLAADDVFGKCFVLWFPIMTFACIGYEHSVANMFFIPCGLFYGAPVSWGLAIGKNILLVTAGNLVGAVVMCDLFFWFGFGRIFMRENPDTLSPRTKPTFLEALFPCNPDPNLHRRTAHLPKGPIFMTDIASLAPPAPLAVAAIAPRYTKRYIRKDGSVVSVEIDAKLLQNDKGEPKKLEAYVSRRNKRDAKPAHLVVAVDSHGRAIAIEDADDNFQALLGYSHEELVGRRLTDVTHTEDRGVTDEIISTTMRRASEKLGCAAAFEDEDETGGEWTRKGLETIMIDPRQFVKVVERRESLDAPTSVVNVNLDQ